MSAQRPEMYGVGSHPSPIYRDKHMYFFCIFWELSLILADTGAPTKLWTRTYQLRESQTNQEASNEERSFGVVFPMLAEFS